MWAVALILIVSFMDETFYDRKIPRDQQPVRKSRILRVVGVEQFHSRHQRNTFLQAISRPAIAITKIPVILITLYYVFTFGWVIGLNATTGVFLKTVYHFGPESSGMFPTPLPYPTPKADLLTALWPCTSSHPWSPRSWVRLQATLLSIFAQNIT